MNDRLDDARAVLPGVRLDGPHTLGGSERSEVRRVRARWPDAPETTVIVKTFADPEGWVREAAALASVPDGAPTPRLVAESATPPLVVMTDLGDGGTVADALLGTDARAAGDAVIDWAHTIGMLHRVTQGAREVFRAALGRRSGEALLGESRMSIIADESAMRIEALCTQLGVLVASGALGELRELPRRLSGDGPGALSPHDACPDNNIRTENGLVLIDFEDAQWRHVAWDVAYLTVPWPSCWCSWRMPGDVAERALERYRTTVETELPYVRTPQFRHDVAAAAVGWSFISASWFLPNALGDDPPPENPAQPTPTRRAMILHRLGAARRNEDLPALAELAGRLRAALVERWGEVPLAYAPAFDAE